MCKRLIYLISVLVLALCLMSSAYAAEIVVVNEAHDYDNDGNQDDHQLVEWLEAEGHLVVVQHDNWTTLDPDKIKVLNAADLIIVSRTCNSTLYDEGDEPTQWNSVTTPLILMQALITRSNRWKWVNSSSANSLGGSPALEVIEPDHPIFTNVTIGAGNLVQVVDPAIGSGHTSSVNANNVGNGTLIAKEEGTDLPWIAEWEAGVEFYDGAGEFPTGKRIMFFAGTQETDGPPRTPWGAWNFTDEGEIMFRNAIRYMLGSSWEPGKAYGPIPDDGAIYADTWVNISWRPGEFAVSHDVYLGDNFDDVNAGAESTFQGNQAATFSVAGFPGFAYPDGLVPGTTYYWRIDEVNDSEPNSPWKGDVWSFSVPPKTAYFPNPADGAESVDVDVQLSWTAGFAAKLHTVYFGESFDEVDNASGGSSQGTLNYNPGALEMAKTYYWRVDEFDVIETHKGDVWSFITQGAVGSPSPAKGAVDLKQTQILSWSPGIYGASHEVYFGIDKDAVKNADTTSPEYKGSGTLGSESYDAGNLEWNTTYYWRIDEANNANADSPCTGPLWSFTTANFLIVDDFESYNDLDPSDPASNRIFNAWLDGLDNPENGSIVGYENPPFAEQRIIHSGSQSMPLSYDNSIGYSEATMTLADTRDWTVNGVNTLTIWFRGEAANVSETLYVALNDSAVVTNDNPEAALRTSWTQWNIDLTHFADQGVNLANVNTIAIGLGNKQNPVAGGSGTMYFDDIRLYPPPPEPAP
ncbi:MAG: hypothetical protein ACETWQ_20885 [Phycisphaerae bacterium]